ncbi:hypothetical protein B0T16DRAFT_418023 [Cercophora newfieldiana]|uniref:Zn(2)-C6 fungal-type domain-containing protein n=1 Tax=Cercophora newfieldiana TaxID=92897 RepID=A0AA39Y2C4_9PEZI|nr:hypothetical protein B0T16DRAFT_418023 [Cercophora newfieldiana]
MGSLYFCPVCMKPFDEETSHIRHVQYCRRRASSDSRTNRPRACQACRSGKVKCDFGKPCSRCVGRNADCVYERASRLESAGKGGNNSGNLPVNAEKASFGGLAVVGNVGFPPLTATEFAADEAWPLQLHLQEIDDPTSVSVAICPPSIILPTPFGTSLVPYPRRRITPGCRQLIISTVRSYPRMMTRLDNLPPFIHHVGCQLHFSAPLTGEDISQNGSCVFTTNPLRPLVTCMRLAQVFVSGVPEIEGVLWDAVEGECRRIAEEMQDFSPGEALTSLQAMIIYTIMRLMNSGISYFLVNRDMLKTNRALAAHFLQLCPGPFSPPHARLCRPTWEEWILEETRRRIVTVCYLLDLVAGAPHPDICELFADPHSISLPSSRMLWEARTAAEWEKEYDVEWAQLTTNQARLDTVGDLALAKDVGSDGAMAQGRLGGLFADAMDNWHAGLDGLGMLIAAVMASS